MPRRRWAASRAVLVAAVALLGVGANATATAQSSGSLTDQFGGFKLASRGNGFVWSFDSPGLVPIASPLFETGIPEGQATMANGPSGYALGSLAYPGPLLANVPAIAAQGGAGENSKYIPPYPIKVEAFYPQGPTHAEQSSGGATSTVTTDDVSAKAFAEDAGNNLSGFFTYGSVSVDARTELVQGQVVSHIISTITDVDVLGVLHIGSVVTDMVAQSDGTVGSSDGATTANDVKFLGLDSTIDAGGLHLVPTDAATGPLSPIAGPLQPVAQGLTQLVTAAVGAQGTVNDLLKSGGISVRMLDPIATQKGPFAQRVAHGLLIEITYTGATEPVVSSLLPLVPADQLPTDPLAPGVPLNTSPSALFNLLSKTYVTDIALAPGDVSARASPAFSSSVPSLPGSVTNPSGVSTPTGVSALPSTGGSRGAASPSSLDGALPISLGGEPLAGLLGVLILALAAGLFGPVSTKLADNSLAEASSSCPEGRERPDAVDSSAGGS